MSKFDYYTDEDWKKEFEEEQPELLQDKLFRLGYETGLDACIQTITDNQHKSPIEAINDMRRKQ